MIFYPEIQRYHSPPPRMVRDEMLSLESVASLLS